MFQNVDTLAYLYNDFNARHEVGTLAPVKDDAEVSVRTCMDTPRRLLHRWSDLPE